MGVPEQVRRAGERAKELLDQANGVSPETDSAPTPAVGETPEPQVEQPKESSPAQEPAPAAQTADPPQPTEPTPEPPAPKVEDFEHKYKTLQGVFNAESGRWRAEHQAMDAELKALRAQVAAQPAKPAQPEPPATPASLITDEEMNTYGPELLDLIGRKASEMAEKIVSTKLAALQPEFEKTRASVNDVANRVYQSAEERFQGELAKAVPDWQTVNVDPRFLAWLGEVDPMSGVPRQQYLNHAAQQLDHAHAATLFKAFKASVGEGEPEPGTQTTTAPVQAKPTVSPTPRTVGNATAPSPREPDTSVNRAEISAHYKRASIDPVYRTSKDHEDMEKRISTAMASGTVTG